MKDVGDAGFAGISPPFLGRERAAVDVDVAFDTGARFPSRIKYSLSLSLCCLRHRCSVSLSNKSSLSLSLCWSGAPQPSLPCDPIRFSFVINSRLVTSHRYFPQRVPFFSASHGENSTVIAIAHLMAQTLYSPVMAQPQQGPSRKQQVIFVTCRTSVAELAAACGVRSTWLATIGPNVRGTLHCPGPGRSPRRGAPGPARRLTSCRRARWLAVRTVPSVGFSCFVACAYAC